MADTTPDTTAATTAVDFWFDPLCPWAWMTSRWIDEVARQRPIDVTWHVMSLAILNEGVDNDYTRSHAKNYVASRRMGQLVCAVQQEHGNEQVKALYDALGQRIHLDGRGAAGEGILEEVVAELGIAQALVDRVDAGEFAEAYAASHADAIARVGDDVGTPVIAVNGTAFFGPVISPAPKGEEALRLFDGVVAAASYPGFFELKRSRTTGPVFN